MKIIRYGFISWFEYDNINRILYSKDSNGFEKCYKYNEFGRCVLLWNVIKMKVVVIFQKITKWYKHDRI